MVQSDNRAEGENKMSAIVTTSSYKSVDWSDCTLCRPVRRRMT